MRKVLCFTLVVLVLLLGAPKVLAATTTYTMTFTVTNYQNVSAPPTGYFTYDTTANQFTQFIITWDGVGPVDIASTLNTQWLSVDYPALPPIPAGCFGVNTAQTNFYMLTVPACGSGALGWAFGADQGAVNYFQVLYAFSSSINGKFEGEASFSGTVPTGDQYDGAGGTFTVQVQPRSRPPVGGWLGQIVRIIAGPVYVPPGVPVEFTIGFVDVNGNFVGPTSTNTVTAGQWATLDLDVDNYIQQVGQRLEVRPVVTAISPLGTAAAAPSALSFAAGTEVIDKLTGYGQILVPDSGAYPPDPLVPPQPTFELQGLAGGQTMRINVYAVPPLACNAVLSFAGINGNPLGSTQQVSLSPGTGASLDLNSSTLGLPLGQRIEVQPIVTITPVLTSGPPIISACSASAEVFGNLAGKTWTYQSGGN